MSHEALTNIARQIKVAKAQLAEAKELLAALEEAGEATDAVRQAVRSAEARLGRWEAVLQSRHIVA